MLLKPEEPGPHRRVLGARPLTEGSLPVPPELCYACIQQIRIKVRSKGRFAI
jgi:hypothetical protein